MTEFEKLLNLEIYNYRDKSFGDIFDKCTMKVKKYNKCYPKKQKILDKIVKSRGDGTVLVAPVHFDLGFNVVIGNNSFINANCTFLDCAPITIGNNVFIGPNVSLITPIHPLDHKLRNQYYEVSKPITIKNNVWIAANVIIMPGVTIESGSVIGAGSIVTSNIPKDVVAYGSPCKVVKSVFEEDEFTKIKI